MGPVTRTHFPLTSFSPFLQLGTIGLQFGYLPVVPFGHVMGLQSGYLPRVPFGHSIGLQSGYLPVVPFS
jgi:hypothetical protein